MAAAADLSRIELAEALSLSLLLRTDGERYGRATARWLARFCAEQSGVTLDEVTIIVDACAEIHAEAAGECVGALSALLEKRNMRECAQRLSGTPPSTTEQASG